jgi:fructokinase
MNAQTAKRGRPRIIGLGEVLWDLLPAGKQLGGAPANFAYHAHALGAEALVVSRVGQDALGHEILERLRHLGLRTDGIATDPAAPTGTVSVSLGQGGQPTYTIHENVAWDFLAAPDAVLHEAAQVDALCFGSLAQRNECSRASIRKLVAAAPRTALRIFDINLRQHFYNREVVEASLHLANVLKINDQELPVVAAMLSLAGTVEQQLRDLCRRFDLRLIALTRGAQGSLLYSEGRAWDCPASPAPVVDTVGAGDSFTAALALGVLAGWDLELVNRRANELAAYVCSQAGATPPLPEALRQTFTSA